MLKKSARECPQGSPFNIHDYLKDRRSLIDRALERYLEESSQYPPTLHRAMHYGLFSGGKRLRPILTLASGELFGAPHNCLLPFACAIELIHTYSIIHDDLPALDNDDLRRGEPASHKVFGEGVALLAGDALLTEAFHLMTRPEVLRRLEATLVLELVHEISHGAGMGGMVGGQIIDLEAEGCVVDVATVEQIHVRKTGALIHAAVRVGARVGRARPGELKKIIRYADFLGLAFQIADDILDTQEQRGDEGEGKATYPSIVGMRAAKERVKELLQDCLNALESFGPEADPLRGIAQSVLEPVV